MAHPLEARWNVTRALLSEAQNSLAALHTDADYQSLFALYREFIDHNELGLALDSLVNIARESSCPETTWKLLSAAADSMDIKLTI